jgi:hypothetical protein
MSAMNGELGQALEGFQSALDRFRDELGSDPAVADAVFSATDEWRDLLRYKLVPHLSGEGCLIAAVAGGTNTGKSTVFNLLLRERVSPIVATAAATRRPVIAGNRIRAAQCLESKLVPEFDPRLLENPDDVVGGESPDDALFVVETDRLPDRLVLLDTPDVDSIDTDHWAVAEHIRAAGDVLVAVVTGEKYKDERVVAFFRRARESGRVVVPVMNKSNPADDFAVARRQLEEFRSDVDIDAPGFAVAHDFNLNADVSAPIRSLDGDTDLFDYLGSLDVPAIKRRVYRGTVERFAHQTGDFLNHAETVAQGLRAVAHDFEARAKNAARSYDPAPGTEVSGLFHEYIQEKRGPVRRVIGSTSKEIFRGARYVARSIRQALQKRADLDTVQQPPTDAEIRADHVRAIDQIARALATSYIESSRNASEPAGHLLEAAVAELDADAAVAAVVGDTVRSESISGEFRQHAHRMLDEWWRDHTGKRRVLEGLDTLLALTPAAIAVPISLYTAGVGVSETVVVAGPFVEQFLARVIELQFGDAMFDFLSPWKHEQQQALEDALRAHVTDPCLAGLRECLAPFESESFAEMRKWQAVCLNP